ncbi:MAG: TadE/TadG family type IV pilus assembly protein [Candidatus Limnocylindria bacterium]
MLRRFGTQTRGQSLVETALALPILLLLVLGIADLGRYGYYAIAVSHAAHDAAAYAAKDATVTQDMVRERVCTEMRIGPSDCAGAFSQFNLIRESADTTVAFVYEFTLITGLIAEGVGVSQLALTAEATYSGYTQ